MEEIHELSITDIIKEEKVIESPEITQILFYRYLELFYFTKLINEYTYPKWKESFDFLLTGYLGCLNPKFVLSFGEALLELHVNCGTTIEENLYHENYKLLSSILSNLLSTIGQSR